MRIRCRCWARFCGEWADFTHSVHRRSQLAYAPYGLHACKHRQIGRRSAGLGRSECDPNLAKSATRSLGIRSTQEARAKERVGQKEKGVKMTRAPPCAPFFCGLARTRMLLLCTRRCFETRAYGLITRTSVNWGDSIPTWLHVAQRFRELIAAKAMGPKRVASTFSTQLRTLNARYYQAAGKTFPLTSISHHSIKRSGLPISFQIRRPDFK